jgi:nicotinamidase-related amidase
MPIVSDLSEFEFDLGRTALLVIDAQNDFCKPEGFFSKSGFDVAPCQAAVDRIRPLLEEVRAISLPVFWTMSLNPDPPNYKLPPTRFRRSRESQEGTLKGVRGSDYFAPDAWGTQIVEDIVPSPDDVVVRKPRYDGFYNTQLDEELRSRGIDTLAIVGVTTNCCVDTTTRDAFMRGFHVLVLADCVAAFGNEWDLHEASLKNLSLLFAVIGTSDDFVRVLREATAKVPAPVS